MTKRDQLKEVCERFNLGLVYLFGSQAETGLRLLQGQTLSPADPLADLDLGVATSGELPPAPERARFYALLHNELQDIFTPFPLDLTLLEENHSVFQAEAIKGFCIYSASPQQREDYEMNILRRAADFRPFLERFLEEALQEV